MGTETNNQCEALAVFNKSGNELEWLRNKNSGCIEIQSSEFDVLAEIPEFGVGSESRITDQ